MQLCRTLSSFLQKSELQKSVTFFLQRSQGRRARMKALGLQPESSEHSAAMGACTGPQWPTAVGLMDPLDAPSVSSYNMASSACQDGHWERMEMDDTLMVIGIMLWDRHINIYI